MMYFAERKKWRDGAVSFEVRGPYTIDQVFDVIGHDHINQDIEKRPELVWKRKFNSEDKNWGFGMEEFITYRIVTENGTILTDETILGLYREWKRKKNKEWRRRYQIKMTGWKNSVYGKFRHPRTLNELRSNFSLDEDDIFYGVKVRSKRKRIPTAWDDKYSHAEKSWKYQKKRGKQWKSK